MPISKDEKPLREREARARSVPSPHARQASHHRDAVDWILNPRIELGSSDASERQDPSSDSGASRRHPRDGARWTEQPSANSNEQDPPPQRESASGVLPGTRPSRLLHRNRVVSTRRRTRARDRFSAQCPPAASRFARRCRAEKACSGERGGPFARSLEAVH